MAEEQASVETPAPETVETPAPAPAAPAEDQEKIALRGEVEKMRAALGEVGEMVKSGKLKWVDGELQQTQQSIESDDSLVDMKKLREFGESLKQTVGQAVLENTAVNAHLTRENTIELLGSKLKNFGKYKAEVVALLDKMDPRVASRAETITQAYKVVRANHFDDELQEELASRAAMSEEDEGEGDFPAASTPSRIPAAIPSAGRSGVAPSGNANFARPGIARRQAQVKPLSRDEQVAAGLFGITDAEEYRRYADKSWRPDMLGSKGRQKF